MDEPKELTIEYEETTVAPGDQLKVMALSPSHVRIIEVAAIGPDLRYRYVIFWENGSAPEQDGNGA